MSYLAPHRDAADATRAGNPQPYIAPHMDTADASWYVGGGGGDMWAAATVKVFSGAAWAVATVKVWNGAAWAPASIKRW